ncbi:hypothetical protein Francci3_1130 [Frankia casuarinae]|uniref:HTH cro/C1-type domain-containing protein n=1 Tax=Frankia casuarinae (strain DSM 45818 / CECT 9043 / HFP020203 / CcI3) TaxID=106370 RepID=Q2JDY3_FRACC|nr:hypothetical protein Francci3_1130 [Frankia casuarinae]
MHPPAKASTGRPKVQAGQRNDALANLADLLRTLRDQHRTNNSRLEARTGFKRQQISRAVNGQEIPSADLADALDTALAAAGAIRRLRDEAVREKRARDLGLDPSRQEEPVDANRRQAFELAAASLVAAQMYREWTSSAPDVLTLDEIDDAINAHTVAFTVEPHQRLAPKVWKTWKSAHHHLMNGSGRARPQTRLTVAAGYASYMLSRLSFNLGDTLASRRFIRLAEDHASQTDDVVLTASVGEMVTTLAFYGRRYQEAAVSARKTAVVADNPYTRARIASYEARALGALGDVEGTRAALNRMRTSVTDLPLQPGISPFGPAAAEMMYAGVLTRIGGGVEAEPIARAALAAYEGGQAGGFEDYGHALLALAASLTAREQPEIDEAATMAGKVVDMLDTRPTASVSDRVAEIAIAFTGHPTVEPVRDFWDRWQARPRLELTTGQA